MTVLAHQMQYTSRSYSTQEALRLTAPDRPACTPLRYRAHLLIHAVAMLHSV